MRNKKELQTADSLALKQQPQQDFDVLKHWEIVLEENVNDTFFNTLLSLKSRLDKLEKVRTRILVDSRWFNKAGLFNSTDDKKKEVSYELLVIRDLKTYLNKNNSIQEPTPNLNALLLALREKIKKHPHSSLRDSSNVAGLEKEIGILLAYSGLDKPLNYEL